MAGRGGGQFSRKRFGWRQGKNRQIYEILTEKRKRLSERLHAGGREFLFGGGGGKRDIKEEESGIMP